MTVILTISWSYIFNYNFHLAKKTEMIALII